MAVRLFVFWWLDVGILLFDCSRAQPTPKKFLRPNEWSCVAGTVLATKTHNNHNGLVKTGGCQPPRSVGCRVVWRPATPGSGCRMAASQPSFLLPCGCQPAQDLAALWLPAVPGYGTRAAPPARGAKRDVSRQLAVDTDTGPTLNLAPTGSGCGLRSCPGYGCKPAQHTRKWNNWKRPFAFLCVGGSMLASSCLTACGHSQHQKNS
jgi:hypothetical protein